MASLAAQCAAARGGSTCVAASRPAARRLAAAPAARPAGRGQRHMLRASKLAEVENSVKHGAGGAARRPCPNARDWGRAGRVGGRTRGCRAPITTLPTPCRNTPPLPRRAEKKSKHDKEEEEEEEEEFDGAEDGLTPQQVGGGGEGRARGCAVPAAAWRAAGGGS